MELFTGPYARQMLDPRNGGEVQPDNEKWNVFVLLEKNKQGLVLQKNSEVLYQVNMKLAPRCKTNNAYVIYGRIQGT